MLLLFILLQNMIVMVYTFNGGRVMLLWWIIILLLFFGLLSGMGVWGLILVLTVSMLTVLATLGGVDRRRHHKLHPSSFYHPPHDEY